MSNSHFTSRPIVWAIGLATVWFGAQMVFADPLPGRDVLKFQQRPMLDTPITDAAGNTGRYRGHDELSTAWSYYSPFTPGGPPAEFRGYRGDFMADDFADMFSTPVVHLKWWGSYLNVPSTAPDVGVDRFLISFESDIPADATGGFSRPGNPLLNQIVSRGPLAVGSGTFTETAVFPTSVDGPIFEYNAELHLDKEFFQEPDTVYWLKIVALVDVEPGIQDPRNDPTVLRWGWHNRDYTKPNPLASPAVLPGEHIVGGIGSADIWHFQDDAVNGFVDIPFDPNDPMWNIMPQEVIQDVGGPQHYLDGIDGPDGIEQFSKDLAFELYTIPEPWSLGLCMVGYLVMTFSRKWRM